MSQINNHRLIESDRFTAAIDEIKQDRADIASQLVRCEKQKEELIRVLREIKRLIEATIGGDP
jgi:hypothetical protein